MTHLKRFNESISKEIEQNLNDICLELTDVGFDVYFYHHNDKVSSIKIYKEFEDKIKPFKYSEISETINRIEDYLKQFNINIKSIYSTKTNNSYGYVRMKIIPINDSWLISYVDVDLTY